MEDSQLCHQRRVWPGLRGDIAGRHHPAQKFERQHLEPVKICLNDFPRFPLSEIVEQFDPSLPGEALDPLSFFHPDFQFGARFRRECRPGPLVNGTASGQPSANGNQQELAGGNTPQRWTPAGLTRGSQAV